MSNLNVDNRAIFCRDNLDILQGINSDSIDLIYLDPPFNKNKKFTAPMGSSAEGAEFSDIFREADVKDEWIETIKEDYDGIYQFLTSIKNLSSFQSSTNKHYLYNYCYLCYMAVRLIEVQRILKDTGSIYLHCDSTMSHYLRILMDLIFGEKNFRNEIIWKRYTGSKTRSLIPKSLGNSKDIIFFYAKTNESVINGKSILIESDNIEKKFKHKDKNGAYYLRSAFNPKGLDPRPNQCFEYNNFFPPYKSGWSFTKETLVKMHKNGDLVFDKKKPKYKQRYRGGIIPSDLWSDINVAKRNEKTGYPTQKPLALLERIIQASSNEGDVVLDPFCGCATTCVAAEKLNRKWIGIDVSVKAYELVKKRLKKEIRGLFIDIEKDLNYSTKPPKRTDTNGDERLRKYVYIISNPQYKGLYKVGIAKNYKSRLNSYQTSDPLRQYKMEFYFLTPYFREIEKHIHNIFDNLGEWVQAGLENIKKEIENYKK